MSNAVAKVSFLQGQAWAKTADGGWRALTVGSTLNEGEVLVTAQGARIELDSGTGEPLVINGGLTVGMSRDLLAHTATEANEALLSDASVQEALTVLEQGGDLLEELEETAAGNSGGGASEGHSFVQLTRLIETTDPQSFDFSSASPLARGAEVRDGQFINHTPLVTDQIIASNEDEPFTGQIIAEDTEGDAITYTLTTPPSNGVVTLDPVTGQFTFTPNANYNGSDSFVVTVTDSHGNSADTSISLNIAPINDAPTTGDLSLATNEDIPISGQIQAQDIEGDTLSYSLSGQPANGSVVLDPTTGAFVYTPNPNYNGSDSFVVTISDGKGGTTASIITIGVTPANDAPVSSNQNLMTPEDTSIAGQITATDIDGDPLDYAVSGQPTNGTVVLNAATGGFTYTPNANYNGSDSFVVTVSDGNGGTATATVNVTVNAVNDAPVANNDTATTDEDTAVTIAVRGNDTDAEGNNLIVSSVTQGANGSVVIDAVSGNPIYTPNAGFSGSDSFTYTISDGNGGTATATVNVTVTAVNDAPVANNDTATTDEDTAVTIAVRGNDTDAEGNNLTVSSVTQGANGSVVIDAVSGNPIYTPNAGFSGSDSFTYTISDGNGGTATATVNVTVTAVNDAPVANNDTATTDEDTAVTIAVRGNDTDAEGNNLTVSSVTQGANGSVVIDAVSGNPIYTPNAGFSGSDSFTYTISDGNGGTATATVNVTVNAVNDAPVANNDTATTDEDTAVTIAVRGNDTDAEGNNLTVSSVTQGANGSVVIDAVSGNPIYTPNAGFSGSDSFTYTISDGNGGTATATVNVTVTAVNDAPVANNDTATTDEDTAVTIAVRGNDTDAEGNNLTVSSVTQGANGSVVIDAVSGNPIYTPNAGFSGSDSFTYTISDGNGGTATATVNVTVNAVNDAPVANNDTATTDEDTAVTIAVRGNDTDAEGNNLTVSSVTQGANGSVVIDAVSGNPIYTPNAGFSGSDSFTYTISDGNGGTATATVNVTVTAVNDAPVANNDTATTDEDTAVTIAVRGNDTDAEGNNLTVSSVTQGANGSVVIDAVSGNPIYTPNAGFSGSDSFTYTISDGNGGTATATVNVTVNAVNDAPVANNDTATTDEDTAVTIAVRGNDTDAEGNNLTVSSVTQGANGSVVIDAVSGNPIYTPNAGFSGSDSFTYTISDGNGGTSTATVNVTVNAVNDAPVANNDTATTDEDTAVTIAVRGNDTDAEGNNLTVSSVTQGANGSVVIDAVSGNPIYTPNAGFSGSDSFTYTISDGNGGTSTATVNVTVNAVNDAPVANNDTVTTDEDTAVTVAVRGNDTDAEGNNLIVSSVTQGANGSVVIDAVSGNPIYTPNAGFSGSDSFTYTISDGNGGTATATVNVTVTAVNDAPVANNDTATTDEDTAVTIAVRGNDTDAEGNNLTVSSVTQGANGSVVIDAVSGNPIYTPNAGFSGSDSFTYTISDGNGGTSTATVNVTVNAVNDAPVANNDTATTDEDTAVTIAVRGNDTDVEGNNLIVTGITQGTNGSVVIDAVSGNPVYTPNAGFSGSDSFTYTISDGNGGTATATVNVTVNAVNDAPETTAVAVTGDEDTLVTINLAGTDTDGTVTGFVIKTLPANGVLYSDSLMTVAVAVGDLVSGPVYFMPGANWNGSTSLTYVAQDNQGLEDATPATVAITIEPVADAAVLGSGTGAVKEDTPAQSSAGGLLSITDPDAGQSAFQAQTNTSGTYGSFSINSAGNWTYTIDNSKPAVQVLKEGETKTETFTVTSLDGTPTSVVITVTGTNEAPVANGDTAAATAASNTGLVSDYFGYNETSGSPNLTSIEQVYAFINGRTADATFIAKTFDYGFGTAVSTNLGNGTNLQTFLGSDAASLSADPATTTDAIIRMRGFVELGAGTYNFKVTADDGYQIRVDGVVVAQVNQNQSVNTATHTQFTVAAEGLHNIEIIYWDQGGVAKLKLELSDDAGVSYDILSSIPSYRNTVFSAVEDTPVSISAASLLANDTDVNGDTLSIQSVQGAVNGTVSLVAGSVVFTPAANYSGPASFTYTISDGQGGTDTATVNLSIAPVNDAPVAVANTVIATPNTALSIPLSTLLANDSDADKDALSLVSIQGAVNGTVSVSGTNVVFTPISNYEGAGSFTYTIRDPAGATSTATVNVNIGSATQPSVVVSKTVLAIAHGTAGVSVKFPITTALVDTDGSESISVRISGVPTGATFNAGTNLGSGVWLVGESDLTNLMLNLPGSYSTTGTNLTVQVIATEINGGMTASTSVVVRLEAAYTTVDTPTPYHGNLTATNASEYLTGDDGNNVIVGKNGSDIINGGAGDDTLSASSGSDIFFGGAGNDVITGSAGVDRISGGSGNDTLNGFVDNFVDVFVWSLGDQGVAGTPAVDTVQNFAKAAPNNNSNGGDVLDLRDLLIGEHVGANNSAGNLADFLHFEVAGGSTTIHISHTGGFGADSHTVGAAYTSSAETQKIVLSGVDLQSHYSGATTDQQIITQLLNNNKLITD